MGMMPGMIGNVTPARSARRDIVVIWAGLKNSWVMAKSAPLRCLAANTSMSSSGRLDSGCPLGYAATPIANRPAHSRATWFRSTERNSVTSASACAKCPAGGAYCPGAKSPRIARNPRTPESM